MRDATVPEIGIRLGLVDIVEHGQLVGGELVIGSEDFFPALFPVPGFDQTHCGNGAGIDERVIRATVAFLDRDDRVERVAGGPTFILS